MRVRTDVGLIRGETFYSVDRADKSLICSTKLGLIDLIHKYWTTLLGTVFPTSFRTQLIRFLAMMTSLGMLLWARATAMRKRVEIKRVKELVVIALQQLQDQVRLSSLWCRSPDKELLHYSDPVLYPSTHISPLNLRDLILSKVHSPSRRQSLWCKVEKVVEGNSNVRAREVIGRNGEEMRVWEWVGEGGSPVKGKGKSNVRWVQE